MRPIKFRAWDGKYEIGSDGSVWSTDFNHTGKKKQLRQYLDQDGYPYVVLNTAGKRSKVMVHRAIAQLFISDPPTPKHQVNHKNRIRNDNRLENLEWVTARENVIHGWRTGRTFSDSQRKRASLRWRGQGNPKAKATSKMIVLIKKLRNRGHLLREIAKKVPLSISQISLISRYEHPHLLTK